jgi:hypothetical protein
VEIRAGARYFFALATNDLVDTDMDIPPGLLLLVRVE